MSESKFDCVHAFPIGLLGFATHSYMIVYHSVKVNKTFFAPKCSHSYI